MLQRQREKTQNKTKKQDESVQGLKKQTVALIARAVTVKKNVLQLNRHTQRSQVIMMQQSHYNRG